MKYPFKISHFLFLISLFEYIFLVWELLIFTSDFLDSKWPFCKGLDYFPMIISVCSLGQETTSQVIFTWSPNMVGTYGFLCLLLACLFLSTILREFQVASCLQIPSIPCTLISVSTLLINQYWVNQSSLSKITYYLFIPFLKRSSPSPQTPFLLR